MKNIFITGNAGFIGYHVAKLLLEQGFRVHGYDGFTNYYDLSLKHARNNILKKYKNFTSTENMLENNTMLNNSFERFQPEVIIHLAAQAGVRYSLENPRAYIDSNIIGTFNVLEAAKKHNVKHLLLASTSSVYGGNLKIPFVETDKSETQLSLYAASKKANESMAHSYSHLWKIPTTIFRFFTVYGPWGRPDMALFKFVKAIINDEPIDIFNRGEMYRDLTYIDDLVWGIKSLINQIPSVDNRINILDEDSISPVAPFRIVNIGNSKKVKLLELIDTIEEILKKKATRKLLPMQKGDVFATWADASLLKKLTNYRQKTNLHEGVKRFIAWYQEYYKN